MNKKAVWAVVILVIVAGVAFWGGMAYANSQTPERSTTAAFAGRTGFTRGSAAGGGATIGQIVSTGSGNISIQMTNSSSSEIVLLSPTTQILKTVSGSASDLTVGTNVTVIGTTNSDGSVSATSIQIRPAGIPYPGSSGGFTGGAAGAGSYTGSTQ